MAQRLREGKELTAEQRLRLELTCRIATHAYNLSLSLFQAGEVRQDGDVKLAVARLEGLVKLVGDNLRTIFPDGEPGDGGDLLSQLAGGRR